LLINNHAAASASRELVIQINLHRNQEIAMKKKVMPFLLLGSAIVIAGAPSCNPPAGTSPATKLAKAAVPSVTAPAATDTILHNG
jgi:hypothetical protein